MSTFFFIRHGESDAFNFIAGRSAGVHLTPKGKEEAENTAHILLNLNIDKIYCSPLERTLETANIISKKLNIKIEVNKVITEVDFGDWTRKTFSELQEDPRWNQFNSYRSGTRIPNGELMIEVRTRMIKEIERLRNINPNKNIILVSHGDPIRLALSYYIGIPIDFILRLKMDTASISILKLDDTPQLICYNFSGNLKDAFS